jgi:Ion channel
MAQTNHIAILLPLAVGAVAVLCTVLIHALAFAGAIQFIRREKSHGRLGTGLWIDLAIIVSVIWIAFVAHLIEIALWAKLFVLCGEFSEFQTAYYHSAVNYTTLGYGDLIMTPSWRLLGPLEAADGALMFGVSTAMIFAVILRMIQAKYEDLRS